MADQEQDLIIRTTFVDNASPGLQQLRKNFKALVDETTAGVTKMQTSFEKLESVQKDKLKRSNEDLTKQIKEMTNAILGGQQAMLGYIGKWGLFGFAASKGIDLIIQFAGRLQSTSRLAENLGRSFASVHDAIRQFQAGGVSIDKAREAVANLNDAVVELSRTGSQSRIALQDMMGPQNVRVVDEYINRMANAREETDRMRLANELATKAEEARFNWLRSHGVENIDRARADAAKFRRDFVTQRLHVDPEDLRRGATSPPQPPSTPAQIDAAKKTAEESKEATRAWNRGMQEMGDASEKALGTFFKWTEAFDKWNVEVLHGKNSFQDRFGNWPEPNAASGAGKPLRFSGSDDNDVWSQMRPSTNIEDVRDSSPLSQNTKQLSRLNDNIEKMLHPEDGNAGGGRLGLLSPGGGVPGSPGGGDQAIRWHQESGGDQASRRCSASAWK